MFNKNNTKQRFSLRKYTFGTASVLLGTFFVATVGDAEILPNAHVAKAADVTATNSGDFVREWNKPEDKTINLNPAGYTGTVIESQNNNSTTLVNNSTTTVNGNGQDLTLRQMSIDNQKDLTIKNTDINVVADPGLANPSISSSGNLTLENVTTPGVKPDLKVTGGTATVKSAGEGTEFKSADVKNGATLNLEGSKIKTPVVTADATSNVVSSSELVGEYKGGNVTLKNLTTSEVKVTDVKNLVLDGSNITFAPDLTINLDRLEVKAGSTLNIGNSQLNVKELFGTGKIIMNPAATLRVGRLEDAINVEVTNNTRDWANNVTKDYVVVETPVARPVVTGQNTPNGKRIDSEGNTWKLVDDTELDKLDLEDAITQATDPALATAVEEAKNVLANAKTQGEINDAADKLYAAIEAAMNGTLPPAVEKGSVTVSYVDKDTGEEIIAKKDVVRDVAVGTEYKTEAYRYIKEDGTPFTGTNDADEATEYMAEGQRGVYVRVQVETDNEANGTVTKGEKHVQYGYVYFKRDMFGGHSEFWNIDVYFVDEQGNEIKSLDNKPLHYKSEVVPYDGWTVDTDGSAFREQENNSFTDLERSARAAEESVFKPSIDPETKYDVSGFKKDTIDFKGNTYEFVRVKEGNLAGEMTRAEVDGYVYNPYKVILEYRLKPVVEKGAVTVSYVDVDTKQEIIAKKDVVRDVEVGTDYTTEAPTYLTRDGKAITVKEAADILATGTPIYARAAVETDNEPTGKVTAGEKHVEYAYVLVEWEGQFHQAFEDTYSVVVKYVDEAGTVIKDDSSNTIKTYSGFVSQENGGRDVVDEKAKQHEGSVDALDAAIYNNVKVRAEIPFDGNINETDKKVDTITFDGKVYEYVREKENKLVNTLAQTDVQANGTHEIVLEYRLKPETFIPTEDIPTVEVPEGNISVPNLPGEVPPTVEEKPEGNISVPNLPGEVPPTVEEKPEGNISVPNLPGEVPPAVEEKPEGNISVPNLPGEVPPTVEEKPEGNISVPNLPGEVPPTVDLPEGKLPQVSTNVPNEGVPFPTVDLPEGQVPQVSTNVPNEGVPFPTVDLPEGQVPQVSTNVPNEGVPFPTVDLPEGKLPQTPTTDGTKETPKTPEGDKPSTTKVTKNTGSKQATSRPATKQAKKTTAVGALPKTSATTETNSALPAGLAAALAAAGLLATRRKGNK